MKAENHIKFVMRTSFRQIACTSFYLLLNAQCCILEEV
jgi:hypothetical protein